MDIKNPGPVKAHNFLKLKKPCKNQIRMDTVKNPHINVKNYFLKLQWYQYILHFLFLVCELFHQQSTSDCY